MTSAPQSNAVRLFNMAAFLCLMVGLPIWVWYCQIAVRYYDGAIVWPGPEFWTHVEAPSLDGFLFYVG